MLLTKRRDTCEQLSNPGPSRPNKLFVGYPYPILNELEKSCIKRKTSGHSYTSAPLHRCNHILKKFVVTHDIHKQGLAPSILEKSSQQLKDNKEKSSKSMRIKNLLAGLRSLSSKKNENQSNDQKNNAA